MKSLSKTLLLGAALVISSGVANAESPAVQPPPQTTDLEINLDLSLTMTGQEKIDALISSLGAIKNRVTDNAYNTVGAVGYAALGGVVVDDAFDDGLITQSELDAYLEAHDLVVNHDYATATTAQELFTQEYTAAMNDLDEAIDLLADASAEILTATGIMEIAATADTSPEQTALQGMMATDEYS